MARITVFGAGIFGLSIAWSLRRRGADVIVVDPKGPAAGASGGIVGALAPHVPEAWNEKKAFQFDSLLMAEAMWAEVAEVSGQDPGYARTGRVQPLADDAAIELARSRSTSADVLWQGRFQWRVENAAGSPISSPTGQVVCDTLSARIHPLQATLSLAEALRRRGVPIVEDPSGGSDLAVWATGADGLVRLSEELDQEVGRPIKGQAALLSYAAPDHPQVFAEGLHIIPHGDGTTAVGSTTERDFDNPTATDAALDELLSSARNHWPELSEARVLARWAGLRPRARSRAPILGAHPTRTDTFIANGGFKIGFGMAPKVGEVMADLMLDGVDDIPESFRLEANLR